MDNLHIHFNEIPLWWANKQCIDLCRAADVPMWDHHFTKCYPSAVCQEDQNAAVSVAALCPHVWLDEHKDSCSSVKWMLLAAIQKMFQKHACNIKQRSKNTISFLLTMRSLFCAEIKSSTLLIFAVYIICTYYLYIKISNWILLNSNGRKVMYVPLPSLH